MSSPDPKARLLCSIWFAFVLGAAAGAAMVLRFKALGIFGAALLLFVLMIRQWASAEPFAAASVPE